jgi:hypothetical protein
MLLMNTDSKDKYTQLGIFGIHKQKLHYKCQLQLKYYKSRGTIPAFNKTLEISFHLQQFLINLLETNDIDYDLLNELSFSNTLLMESILRRAKIIESLDYKRPKKVIMSEQIRHRLFILQGSIDAGNEGSEIYKECLSLIEKLHTLDELSNYDYFALKKVLKSV